MSYWYQTWRDHRCGMLNVTVWTDASTRTTTMAWREGEAGTLAAVRREVESLRNLGYTPFLRVHGPRRVTTKG